MANDCDERLPGCAVAPRLRSARSGCLLWNHYDWKTTEEGPGTVPGFSGFGGIFRDIPGCTGGDISR